MGFANTVTTARSKSAKPAAKKKQRQKALAALTIPAFLKTQAARHIAVRIAVIVCAAPFVLTLAYTFLPAISTPMLGRLVTGQRVERIWTPLEAISPTLARAVAASEDAKFCTHHGVDWEAIGDQLSKLEEGGKPRGASTITMQLAKNLFLWPGRSYIRKALEIPLALWIDLVLSKHRILELYLNIAEWGDGVFGAEAAARHHFNKPAAALSRTEAARLATALPNPIARDPASPSKRHSSHARTIRGRTQSADYQLDCVTLSGG